MSRNANFRIVAASLLLALLFVLPSSIGTAHGALALAPPAAVERTGTRAVGPAAPSGGPSFGRSPGALRPAISNASTVGVWVQRPTNSSLLQRGSPPMAYDPQLGGIFMFGGYSSGFNNAYDDTWLFKNNTWTNLNATGNLTVSPPGVWWQSVVWDPAGPYIVMFGGRNNSLNGVSNGVTNATWIFNTTGWHQLHPASSPSGRAYSATFYDPVIQKVVLFGGACYYCAATNDTWFFSNGTWTNVSASVSTPPPATNQSIADWDTAAGAGVLVEGGPLGTVPTIPCRALNQTWEFVTGWNLTATVGTPPMLGAGSGAYDSYSSALVIFAGSNTACIGTNVTWAYIQDHWLNLTAQVTGPWGLPSLRCCNEMAYDPVANEILTFGGNAWPFGANRLDDTWTLTLPALLSDLNATPREGTTPLAVAFNSTAFGAVPPVNYTWDFEDGSPNSTQRNTTHVFDRPGGYWVQWSAVDSNGNTLFGSIEILAEDSEGWHHGTPAGALAPDERGYTALAFDPQRQGEVLFGGINFTTYLPFSDTWLFANGSWTDLNASGALPVSPPARWGANLIWDPNGPYLLLFGGRSTTAFFNDTWIFNASGWHLLKTPVAPSPREDTQYFFDPVVGALVLFGGTDEPAFSGFVGHNDTWYFAGGVWKNVTSRLTTASPPPTTAAPTAWDPTVDAAVMASGQSAGGGCATYNTTWTFATGWNESIVSPNPGAAALGPTSAYDAVDGVLLFYGGEMNGICGLRGSTWEYSGGTWTNLTPVLNASDPYPPERYSSSMVYDPIEKMTVLFGGVGNYYYTGSSGGLNDTWTFPVAPFVAAARAADAVGFAPYDASFTSQVSGGLGPYYLNWSFGDGSANATTSAPQHLFATPGTYTVTLHATDQQGRSLNRTIIVQVVTSLVATANASTVYGEAPLVVNFTAPLSGGASPYRYLWNFGDGTSSTLAAPSHVFSSAADFAVTVKVTDAIGEVSNASLEVQVLPSVQLAMASGVERGIAPYGVAFNATVSGGIGPYTYFWQFGDGAAGSANSTPSHLYPAAGTYFVNATVTDGLGHRATVTTTVEVARPLAAFLNATPRAGIAPLAVGLVASAGGGFPAYGFSWAFGDGTPASSGPNQLHTFAAPGVYRVTLTVTDSIGTVTNSTVVVNVVSPLTATVSPSSLVADAPANISFVADEAGGIGPYTYAWTFGDGGTSTAPTPSHRYTAAGRYSIGLAVADSLGEIARATRTVTIDAALSVTARADPAPATENGTNVTVSAIVVGGAGEVAFLWTDLPWGCVAGNVSTFACVPSSSGNFTLGLTVTDAVHGSASTNLTVEILPAPPATPSTAGSPGTPVWEYAVLLVVVVAVLAAIALVLRGRQGRPPTRSASEEPPDEPVAPGPGPTDGEELTAPTPPQ